MLLGVVLVLTASLACEEGGPWAVANEMDSPIHLDLYGRIYDIEPGDRITFSIFRISGDARVRITDDDGRLIYDETHTSPDLIAMKTLRMTEAGPQLEYPEQRTTAD